MMSHGVMSVLSLAVACSPAHSGPDWLSFGLAVAALTLAPVVACMTLHGAYRALTDRRARRTPIAPL